MANWQVLHACPQCGAPVTLDETDRILGCAFCRTRLYLVPEDHVRYLLPPGAMPGEALYVPYWRLKGLCFVWRGMELDHRHVDATILALENPLLPVSLGMRPQAMQLRFAFSADRGVFFPPAFSGQEAVARISAGRSGPAAPPPCWIGETVSVLYAPLYWQGGRLYDAVLRRPIAGEGALPAEPQPAPEDPRRALRFVPTLCPRCGWDLAGERDAVVLICGNCHTAWTCQGDRWEQIPFEVVRARGEDPWYLPFWRMRPRMETLPLRSYADLVRWANLPRAPSPVLEEAPLYVWSPAFKIAPPVFLRWARQLTATPPPAGERDRLPRGTVWTANLAPTEAIQSMGVTLGCLASDRRNKLSLLAASSLAARDILLVYHPFVPGRSELTHEISGLTIDRRALGFGTGW